MEKRKAGKRDIQVLAAVVIILAALLALPAGVLAHTPGAPRLPEVKLEPIYIRDGKQKVEITLESFQEHYAQQTGKSSVKSVFAVCSYRAVQKAVAELWDEETPERADIRIVSALPVPHSVFFFRMITGDFERLKPETGFQLVLKKGNQEVKDLSLSELERLSQETGYEDFEFQIIRRDTEESLTLTVDPEAWGMDYLSLWKKAIYSIPAEMSAAERLQFSSSYKLADKLMQMEDYELFANIAPPLTTKNILAGIGGLVLVMAILAFMIGGNIQSYLHKKENRMEK